MQGASTVGWKCGHVHICGVCVGEHGGVCVKCGGTSWE